MARGHDTRARGGKTKNPHPYGGGFDDFDFGNVNVIKFKSNTAFRRGENHES